MRISTAAFHDGPSRAMLEQQAVLAKTQNQLATGTRIQTPADDPIGAVHLLDLNRTLAESDQHGKNSDAAKTRLDTEEQALSDAGSLLQRVRELIVQANSGAVDATGRSAIATELQSRVQEMMDIANRRDGSGEYLFAGYATTTQPFSRNGATVAYGGDQGQRLQQIGPTQRIADSDSGFAVFQNVTQGNGTFITAVTNTNTGSVSIDTGTVVNQAAWTAAQPTTYTITFAAPDTYQITNSVPAVVVPAVAGNYTSGSAITFNGAQVTLSGTPAPGDTFTVSAAQKEDVFTSIDKMIAAINAGAGSPATNAQFASKMATALQQLDQADTHLQNVRASIGSRLSILDDTQTARQDFSVELQSTISNLRDVDYASAITLMNRQMLGLQAAQQSYAKMSQLSLFNYV